jgi:hypothetical protein
MTWKCGRLVVLISKQKQTVTTVHSNSQVSPLKVKTWRLNWLFICSPAIWADSCHEYLYIAASSGGCFAKYSVGWGGGEIRLPPYDHLLLQFLLLCIRGRKIIVTTLLFNKVIQFSKILEIIGGGGVVPSVSATGNKRRF